MSLPHILHMLTPLKHMSPFDVNMAADAGFTVLVPYTQVTLDEVTGLVQDAIFSRPPEAGVRTGIFIAGKNAILALDMLEKAKAALVPPFGLSIFADPAGSFTTAAAMVACAERLLRQRFQRQLAGVRVAIFGATGVVGFCSAVIAAGEGAAVTLVGHDGVARVQAAADQMRERFGVSVAAVDGSTEAKKAAAAADAEVIFAAAAAGRRVLDAGQIGAARGLLVAADVNAVPPSGIEGVDLFGDGAPIAGSAALGLGPLAIGNVKYGTESGLFRRMIEAETPLALDFRDAFALARELAGGAR